VFSQSKRKFDWILCQYQILMSSNW
jgi:hypothetical protein